MRLLILVLLALSLSASALAQEGTTPGGDDTTTGGETTGEGAPGSGDAPGEGSAGPIEFVLEGVQEGSATFFRLQGQTQRNPTLAVQPGQEVTIRFVSVSGFHNVHVDGQPPSAVIGDGDELVYKFTAPAQPGAIKYWCDPHRGARMEGTIQVGAAAAPPAGGESGEGGEDISGPTIDLGTIDPACAGKKAPASSAAGEVGGPTIADYVQKCKAGETEVAAAPTRAPHAVDWVLPISWLLIGLGIVGVVWVHKYYKP